MRKYYFVTSYVIATSYEFYVFGNSPHIPFILACLKNVFVNFKSVFISLQSLLKLLFFFTVSIQSNLPIYPEPLWLYQLNCFLFIPFYKHSESISAKVLSTKYHKCSFTFLFCHLCWISNLCNIKSRILETTNVLLCLFFSAGLRELRRRSVVLWERRPLCPHPWIATFHPPGHRADIGHTPETYTQQRHDRASQVSSCIINDPSDMKI